MDKISFVYYLGVIASGLITSLFKLPWYGVLIWIPMFAVFEISKSLLSRIKIVE